MRTLLCCLVALFATPCAMAWAPASVSRNSGIKSSTALDMKPSTRKAFVNSLIAGAIATSAGALPSFADETLPGGVTYKVIKDGQGAKPEIGDLIAIRFKAYAGDIKIDDIFDTPEPYYTRLGSGGLIKGVEQTLPLMKLGDRWELTIPVSTYIPWRRSKLCQIVRTRRLLLYVEPSLRDACSYLAFVLVCYYFTA